MQKEEIQISTLTQDKVTNVKAIIERKYNKKVIETQELNFNWLQLNNKMENLNLNDQEKEKIKTEINIKESEILRKKRQKLSARDFESLAVIGRGAFGEVRLCKQKSDYEIVAVKKMKKHEMLVKNQIAHIRAERDVLAHSEIPWIVDLKYSFQDSKHLYLVMEYLPGGDLMTLLMKKDILTEEESKFYIAECILAVDAVHKMNYIHRDLKPDNILMDKTGHLKLSDFGLCKHLNMKQETKMFNDEEFNNTLQNSKDTIDIQKSKKKNRQLAYSTVGTPDYIAPEVFNQKGYTETVDYWSIGVILFEMLVGFPPFYSDDPQQTCQKIMNWKNTFQIPIESKLSIAATDLIKKLVCDHRVRLGVNGVEEIKAHPFFKGINWKNIRNQKAPNIPQLKNEIDTSNFDKYDEEEPWVQEDENYDRKQDNNFIGYTYKRDIENQRNPLISALEQLENCKMSQPRQDSQPLKEINNSNKIEQNFYLQNGFSSKNEIIKDQSQENSKSIQKFTLKVKKTEQPSSLLQSNKQKLDSSQNNMQSLLKQNFKITDQQKSPLLYKQNYKTPIVQKNNESPLNKSLLSNSQMKSQTFESDELNSRPINNNYMQELQIKQQAQLKTQELKNKIQQLLDQKTLKESSSASKLVNRPTSPFVKYEQPKIFTPVPKENKNNDKQLTSSTSKSLLEASKGKITTSSNQHFQNYLSQLENQKNVKTPQKHMIDTQIGKLGYLVQKKPDLSKSPNNLMSKKTENSQNIFSCKDQLQKYIIQKNIKF